MCIYTIIRYRTIFFKEILRGALTCKFFRFMVNFYGIIVEGMFMDWQKDV